MIQMIHDDHLGFLGILEWFIKAHPFQAMPLCIEDIDVFISIPGAKNLIIVIIMDKAGSIQRFEQFFERHKKSSLAASIVMVSILFGS